MCCSGIVRPHATLAKATFLLLEKNYGRFGNDVLFEKFDSGISKTKFLFLIVLNFVPSLIFALWAKDEHLRSEVLACAAQVSSDHMQALPKRLSSYWEKVMKGLGTTFFLRSLVREFQKILVFDFLEFCSFLNFCLVTEGRTPLVWGFGMCC